jgi:3-methyladenine DNA glycosylase AlkD
MKTDHRIAELLAELKALGSAEARAGMARYGINVERAFGVSIYQLRKVAKDAGGN